MKKIQKFLKFQSKTIRKIFLKNNFVEIFHFAKGKLHKRLINTKEKDYFLQIYF